MALYEENDLYINNSLVRKKEKFVPLNAPNVGMYVCGPTVYSDVHLGNCRTLPTWGIRCAMSVILPMPVILKMMLMKVKTKSAKKPD